MVIGELARLWSLACFSLPTGFLMIVDGAYRLVKSLGCFTASPKGVGENPSPERSMHSSPQKVSLGLGTDS